MSKQVDENRRYKMDSLESGKPTHYLNLGEDENPILDTTTELEKVYQSLYETHGEDIKGLKKGREKTWVDRTETSKKSVGNKDLNL